MGFCGLFLLVLGAAWMTAWAGLSMALGAFLGGLLLADSRYRHQIIADIQPFRGLLLGLFFMSVGMSINLGLLGRQGVQVASLVGGLLLLKATLLWVLCRITGRSHSESVQVRLAVRLEADLVVVGTAARPGITGLIVESTGEAITKSLDCSVLVVKPPGFVTPVGAEK